MTELTHGEKEQIRYKYDYECPPYDTAAGRANAPEWLKNEIAARAMLPDGMPRHASVTKPPETFPDAPVPNAVPKNAALYCILGLIVPGLPSLLLRKDKVVGCIQIGLWVLSWILSVVLIGLLIWPIVAIWAAVTGYQDAQRWNRRHGFIT